jgi:hypothetical protein
MISKESPGIKILLQDTTILQKDTILSVHPQDTIIHAVDSKRITGKKDTISDVNIMKIDSSSYTITEGKIAKDTFPASSRITQYQERQSIAIRTIEGIDKIPYLFDNKTDLIRNQHPLKKFGDHYFFPRDSSHLVYKQYQNTIELNSLKQYDAEINNGQTSVYDMSPDWLMGIIIICLIVLAWLKLFYHKFINHTVISFWNFQLSKKEFRNRNIFARRVAFILNLNFILIGGLFIYLVLNHLQINPLQLKPFPYYLCLTIILASLLLIRHILLIMTGYIFNRQEYFKEYLHQIFLIYKNIGIYFIPLVIAIAYVHDNLRIYLIITGLVLLVMAYLFRFVRGIQIIIKKDVLIFYLILYLCTLEILPVVIYCKFFSSWL